MQAFVDREAGEEENEAEGEYLERAHQHLVRAAAASMRRDDTPAQMEHPVNEFVRRAFIAVAFSCVGCASGGPSEPNTASAGAWPMYRGDLARDGHPSGATLNAAAARHLRLAWTARLGGPVDGTPAVGGGLVVAGSEAGTLAAFRLSDGRRAWQGRALVGVGNPDDGVLAFDAASGAPLWQRSFYPDRGLDLDVGAAPVVIGSGKEETVAVGSTAGLFVDLAAGDGAVRWSQQLVHGSAVHGLIGSPAYADGRLLVPSASPPTGVFALTTTGGMEWRTSSSLPIYSSPAAGDGVAVVG